TFDVHLTTTRAGVAAAAARRWDDAERHYATALATAEATGHELEKANVRRLLGWMYEDRGEPGDDQRAAALIAQAREDYARMNLAQPPPRPVASGQPGPTR